MNADVMVAASSRPLRLRMRPDLIAKQLNFQGQSSWVVQDPVRSVHVRLSHEEYAVLQWLDGARSLDNLHQLFEQRFPRRQATVEELHRYVMELYRQGLIASLHAGQASSLLEKKHREGWKKRLGAAMNPLCIKLGGFSGEGILRFLSPLAGWLFSPLAAVVWSAFAAATFLFLLIRLDEFFAAAPAADQWFQPATIAGMMIAVGGLKVLHELGHALCARYYGAKCSRLGVMLLLFAPCFYCDVSSAWLLKDKRQRIFIAAAGMYLELIAAAFAAVVWLLADSGPIKQTAWNVIAVGTIATWIFNANPLLRYDGYYILSDWIELPNMAKRSSRVFKRTLHDWLFGADEYTAPLDEPRRRFLFGYAVAAGVYRVFLLLGIYWLLRRILTPYGFEHIAVAPVALAAGGMIAAPVMEARRWLTSPSAKRDLRRGGVRAALLAGAVVLLLFVPLPHHYIAPATLRGGDGETVFAVEGGTLAAVHVKPGQQVGADQVLAVLVNVELEQEIIGAEHRLKQQEEWVRQLRRNRGRQSFDVAAPAAAAEQRLAALRAEYNSVKQRFALLQLRAPRDGVVAPAPWKPNESPAGELPEWYGLPLDAANAAAHLTPGEAFCRVVDEERCEVVLWTPEEAIGAAAPGARVSLLFDGRPSRVYRAELSSVSFQRQTRGVGAAVGHTDLQDDGYFESLAVIETPLGRTPLGGKGWARIHTPPRSLAARSWRLFQENFAVGL